MVRSTTERMTVVGVFNNRHEAQSAVRDLKAAGFRDEEIGVVGPGADDAGAAHSVDGGTHAAEGAAAGAATGAGIGALWAVGIAAGLLPAIGPVIAGGIFASILASAAGGAAVATLAGALVGLGIPEDEADYYENEFKSGRTVVTVKTTSRQAEARRILGGHSGYDMESRPDRAGSLGSTTTASAGRSVGDRVSDTAARAKDTVANAADRLTGTGSHGTASHGVTSPGVTSPGVGSHGVADRTVSAEGTTVQLREEQLHAEKVQKQAGEVRVRKDVITEHKTIEVPVTREEVVIERHAARGATAAGAITGDQEIRIPVKEEEIRVTKTPVVKEEVTVGKRKVTETKHVAADVKHEELRVDDTTSTTDPTRRSR